MQKINGFAARLFVNPRSTAMIILLGAAAGGACLSLLLYAYAWDFEAGAKNTFVHLAPFAAAGLLLSAIALYLATSAVADRAQRISAWGAALGMVIATVTFFKLTQLMFGFLVDDAFITFRYAKNLAEGAGPTFNAGGPPVEGYTTFLWMLIMAVPHLATTNAVLFAKLLGLLFGVAALVLTALIVGQAIDGSGPIDGLPFGAFSALLLAAFYPTAVHAVSGMETMLFSALLAATVCFALWSVRRASPAIVLLPVLCLLLGLTRPEGNLINLALLLIAGWQIPGIARRKLFASSILLYVLPGAAYFAWRWSYYGLPFPLPFYLKLLRAQALAGAGEVTAFLLTVVPPLALFLAFALKGAAKTMWLIAAPIIILLGFYLFPQPIMSFDWRFIYPTAPLIFALAGIGAANLVGVIRQSMPELKPGHYVTIAAAFGLVALAHLADVPTVVQSKVLAGHQMNIYTVLGKALNAFPADKPLTLAIGDAGAIPYYSEWKTIDFFGLNDANVMLSGSSDATIRYVVDSRPDLIVITFSDPDQPMRDKPMAKTLYDAVVQAGLAKVGVLKISNSYYLWLFTRPESPLKEYLQNILK